MAIRDNSYETVRYGRVRSYSGYEVLGEPGSRVLRVGCPSLGTAEIVARQGEIVEYREADLGTRDFELRVLDLKYAEGEISYAEYVRRLRALINVIAVEPRTVRCECGEIATVQLGHASQCDECFQRDARAALAAAGYGQICARLMRHGHGLRSLCLTPYGEEHDHDH